MMSSMASAAPQSQSQSQTQSQPHTRQHPQSWTAVTSVNGKRSVRPLDKPGFEATVSIKSKVGASAPAPGPWSKPKGVSSKTGAAATEKAAPSSAASKRKPAKRAARHFVEEPLYLSPSHYTLLQDSAFELLRGLASMTRSVEDDPLYFDQLLGAAVNMKHAFDLGRADVINGTIRPRNTSLCHECITTVSSVWRSGPQGPRTLCNACGLRYYKQNQRRALEAKRREAKDAVDAATSLAALG
ncbi:hypothetical protein GQ54DRAFT_276827, partial [Martensiomyces pterosporus]